MKLIYENAVGRLEFYGGSDRIFNITDIEGLSIPDLEADTVRYPDMPGQTVNRISLLPRTITLSGDIRDKDGRYVELAAKILSKPGVLYVVSRRNTRKISCRSISFEPRKRQGIFVPFALQLICDDPCFTDVSEKKEAIYKREKLFKNEVLFPQMLSSRTTKGTLYNHGSFSVNPVIFITAPKGAACEKGITIANETTGAKLCLSCEILSGETVTVDCDTRKITGSEQGNLITKLLKTTPLSGFFLEIGANVLNVTAEDETSPLQVEVLYQNKYLEAVI